MAPQAVGHRPCRTPPAVSPPGRSGHKAAVVGYHTPRRKPRSLHSRAGMRYRVVLLTVVQDVEGPPVVREAVRRPELPEILKARGKKRVSLLSHYEMPLSPRPPQSDSRAHAASG